MFVEYVIQISRLGPPACVLVGQRRIDLALPVCYAANQQAVKYEVCSAALEPVMLAISLSIVLKLMLRCLVFHASAGPERGRRRK